MVEILKWYNIPLAKMPTWGQVEKGFTIEVLSRSLKLAKPVLLLISPTTRQRKIESIDAHKVMDQKDHTDTYDFTNDNLWNGGKKKEETTWRASIVEGIQDVEVNLQIDLKEGMINYEMAKAWIQQYESMGLYVMNDADTYLALLMRSLIEGGRLIQFLYRS